MRGGKMGGGKMGGGKMGGKSGKVGEYRNKEEE